MHKCEEWSIHELYALLNYQASHTFPHTPNLTLLTNNILTTIMNQNHNLKQFPQKIMTKFKSWQRGISQMLMARHDATCGLHEWVIFSTSTKMPKIGFVHMNIFLHP